MYNVGIYIKFNTEGAQLCSDENSQLTLKTKNENFSKSEQSTISLPNV